MAAVKGATNEEDQDLLFSYGWFVSTDDDETDTAEEDHKESSCPKFLPDMKAASRSSKDLEIQQGNVLGDLI